jgi:hypothetical protein
VAHADEDVRPVNRRLQKSFYEVFNVVARVLPLGDEEQI